MLDRQIAKLKSMMSDEDLKEYSEGKKELYKK